MAGLDKLRRASAADAKTHVGGAAEALFSVSAMAAAAGKLPMEHISGARGLLEGDTDTVDELTTALAVLDAEPGTAPLAVAEAATVLDVFEDGVALPMGPVELLTETAVGGREPTDAETVGVTEIGESVFAAVRLGETPSDSDDELVLVPAAVAEAVVEAVVVTAAG